MVLTHFEVLRALRLLSGCGNFRDADIFELQIVKKKLFSVVFAINSVAFLQFILLSS